VRERIRQADARCEYVESPDPTAVGAAAEWIIAMGAAAKVGLLIRQRRGPEGHAPLSNNGAPPSMSRRSVSNTGVPLFEDRGPVSKSRTRRSEGRLRAENTRTSMSVGRISLFEGRASPSKSRSRRAKGHAPRLNTGAAQAVCTVAMHESFPSKVVYSIAIRRSGSQPHRVVPIGMTLISALEGTQCLRT